MSSPVASIVVPHYNTPRELNLCLACIAHYTSEDVEILVVDNGSTQESLEQIVLPENARLLSRQQEAMDMTPHKVALDLGIAHARSEFIIAMHSDAFVIDPGWLQFLLNLVEPPYVMAGPNSHKLHPISLLSSIKWSLRKRKEANRGMIRPLFCIYRREIFEDKSVADFEDVGGISVDLLKSNRARVIERGVAARYVFHLGGVTRLANLQHREKAKRVKQRQFRRLLKSCAVRAVSWPSG